MQRYASLATYNCNFSIPGILSWAQITGDQSKPKESTVRYLSDHTRLFQLQIITGDRLSDWWNIALACYVADRVSLRDPRRNHRENWVRTFNITIGVRDRRFWNRSDVKTLLKETLQFLTDDRWNLTFVESSSNSGDCSSQVSLPFQFEPPQFAALFSGGLDSFAGAAASLIDAPKRPVLFVSCVTNDRQGAGQALQIQALRRHFLEIEIRHLQIQIGIDWSNSDQLEQENSQRTRGFLFLTAGAIAAIGLGTGVSQLYENGVGAINLPYDGSQIGAMNSRSSHPFLLSRVQRLASMVTRSGFRVTNPYLFLTKREMIDRIPEDLRSAISLTFSCDGFPVRESGKPQCGVCTSCLLRRVSLEAATGNFYESGSSFGTDLTSLEKHPSSNQLRSLQSMDWQVERIKSLLDEGDAWLALVREFPILSGIASVVANEDKVSPEFVKAELMIMYRTYCDDWMQFSARGLFLAKHHPSQEVATQA